MAAIETWCPQVVFGGKFAFKMMSAGISPLNFARKPSFMGSDDQS